MPRLKNFESLCSYNTVISHHSLGLNHNFFTGLHFLGNQTENQKESVKMEEHDTKVIEISPASSEKERKTTTVIQIKSNFYSSEEEDGSPLRPIFCLNRKNNADIKRIEETQDCFILDFDPFESIDLSKLSVSNNPTDADADSDGASDLSVIAEKGQVACRDFPHSRHLCLKFPFETTPHENYCMLCYCYVCDSAAPCKYWTESKPEHCHASEHVGDWKCQRNLRKQQPAV